MSVATTTADAALRRTAGTLVASATWTFAAWIRTSGWTGPSSVNVQCAINDEAGSSAWTNFNIAGVTTGGNMVVAADNDNPGPTLVSSLPTDEWIYTAWRMNGTAVKAWARSATDTAFSTGTDTKPSNAFTPQAHWLLGDNSGIGTSENHNMRWAKLWGAALSDEEVENEFAFGPPRRWADLVDFLHLADGADYTNFGSGGGTWSELGTVNASDLEPPAIWGSPLVVTSLPVSISVEQEGFRFRNDDGSESAATWKAAQDVDASIAIDERFRLRFLLNATGDPAAQSYQLEYRKVGAALWTRVPIDE